MDKFLVLRISCCLFQLKKNRILGRNQWEIHNEQVLAQHQFNSRFYVFGSFSGNPSLGLY